MRALVLLWNVVQYRILHRTCNILLSWTTCKVPWQLRIRRKWWVSAVDICHFFVCVNAYNILPQGGGWLCPPKFGKGFHSHSMETEHFFPPLHKVDLSCGSTMFIFTETARLFWSLSNFYISIFSNFYISSFSNMIFFFAYSQSLKGLVCITDG